MHLPLCVPFGEGGDGSEFRERLTDVEHWGEFEQDVRMELAHLRRSKDIEYVRRAVLEAEDLAAVAVAASGIKV